MRKTKKNLENVTAKMVTGVLNTELRKDANSASCVFLYQPKAPDGLARFRKNDK
ncbi:MAG: cyclic lactone autoinducer peptide [Lachnospiraceae bacterium]|nr:cyclic lactone autoinducer peptide [Lachnospiraceae bacterium]